MRATLEPEDDRDQIRAEEHDEEEAQHVSLGDPEESEASPGAEEEEDDEAE